MKKKFRWGGKRKPSVESKAEQEEKKIPVMRTEKGKLVVKLEAESTVESVEMKQIRKLSVSMKAEPKFRQKKTKKFWKEQSEDCKT